MFKYEHRDADKNLFYLNGKKEKNAGVPRQIIFGPENSFAELKNFVHLQFCFTSQVNLWQFWKLVPAALKQNWRNYITMLEQLPHSLYLKVMWKFNEYSFKMTTLYTLNVLMVKFMSEKQNKNISSIRYLVAKNKI